MFVPFVLLNVLEGQHPRAVTMILLFHRHQRICLPVEAEERTGGEREREKEKVTIEQSRIWIRTNKRAV
jgi:hypothetical protein